MVVARRNELQLALSEGAEGAREWEKRKGDASAAVTAAMAALEALSEATPRLEDVCNPYNFKVVTWGLGLGTWDVYLRS